MNDNNNDNNIALNPFHFFGLTINSTLSELKKIYYELSLCCHPDKGGKKDDMIMLHNCYLYVKEQLTNNSDKDIENSYKNLESDFENFCKKQKETPPLFQEIYDESNDFIKNFNKKFEELKEETNNNFMAINGTGYSKMMEKSEYNNSNINVEYSSTIGTMENMTYKNQLLDENNSDYSLSDANKPLNTIYKKEMIVYSNPKCENHDLTNTNLINYTGINNFGQKKDNLQMSDYVEAFETYNIHENKKEWNKNIGMTDEQYKNILNNDCNDADKFEEQLQNYIKNREITHDNYIKDMLKPAQTINFELENNLYDDGIMKENEDD